MYPNPFGSFFDKPDPSLCDSCQYAYIIEGGSVSWGDKTYQQRYCGKLHIAIHGSGKQTCEHHTVYDQTRTQEAH